MNKAIEPTNPPISTAYRQPTIFTVFVMSVYKMEKRIVINNTLNYSINVLCVLRACGLCMLSVGFDHGHLYIVIEESML